MAEKKSPEEIKELVSQMRDWLNSQPHLPKDIDDKFLLRFLHSCYYDLEAAKTAAELFFTIRLSALDLLSDRDPATPQMQKMLKIVNLAQIRISGGRKLWIWQLNDPGLENYDYALDAKVFLTSTDAWLLDDTDDYLEESDIIVMDVKDLSLKFITKFSMSIARKLTKYQQEAMPIRLKEIHLVNAPSFIDKIFSLIKPILKPEITRLVHFHSAKSDTLSQFLAPEDLPADYGGRLPAMADYNKDIVQLINTHRERLNGKLWLAEKTEKKSKSKDKSEDVSSDFRSLGID